MPDGFYAFYYAGITGSGFGILVLKDGLIAGADAAGGGYTTANIGYTRLPELSKAP